ncbi:hypothetical protein [Agriterribacter sp.]|uniref:hypothetical protein n=1 Tax=Agriterribacter sp. TaxID=2821509 RepID=UPI002CCCCD6F|nr:hypothetical protein [Agriterribacter sp.]HTN07158.1 hypothetical protein [Agriterribacter sp.]
MPFPDQWYFLSGIQKASVATPFRKYNDGKLIFIHQGEITAELENEQLVSQLATSEDIKRIDRQIIEGVRFQFVTKPLFNPANPDNKNDWNQQLQTKHPLYESGEALLENMLKHARFKHHRHLRYLADNHAGHLVKIRFVLQPFSFVFLLEGTDQFHIWKDMLAERMI